MVNNHSERGFGFPGRIPPFLALCCVMFPIFWGSSTHTPAFSNRTPENTEPKTYLPIVLRDSKRLRWKGTGAGRGRWDESAKTRSAPRVWAIPKVVHSRKVRRFIGHLLFEFMDGTPARAASIMAQDGA